MEVIKAEKQFKHFKIIKVQKVRIILPSRGKREEKAKVKTKEKESGRQGLLFQVRKSLLKFCNNLFFFFFFLIYFC